MTVPRQTAALCALAAVALGASGLTSRATAAAKPNIVVIVADDLGYNEAGFNAQMTGRTTPFLTPNLDSLAQQSVLMRQGYAAAPLCGPSRAGLLTGQYQQRAGNEENLPNDAGSLFGFTGSETILPQRLKQQGYTTGALGKWHEGYVAGVNRPTDMGFDEFFGFLSGSRSYFGDAQAANVMYRNNTNVETAWRTEGNAALYDPVKGRYTTDAFGEEAVSFINNHAQDANPFFLYAAFNGVHTPLQAKTSDYNLFSNIADVNDRTVAAQTYALDRSVGSIMAALQSQGVADNTIVVFMGDNGGTATQDNSPLREYKGKTFEGGIRVPFFIKAPGVAPRTYDAPVTFYDIVPTLVTAAGGTVAPEDTAGKDLLPYLSGAQAGNPHDELFFRNRTFWAVRKGDWKLARPNEPQFNFYALYNLAADVSETTNLINQQPEIAADLYREFTHWEATLAKPKWGVLGADDRNKFDHFVYRNDVVANGTWATANQWYEAGTTNVETMLSDDAYANAILEFTTRNDANYQANNNMTRMSGLTFMLNEVRFTGDFNSSVARSGTTIGNALLLTKNLAGQGPKIRLDATSSGSAKFGFFLAQELQLMDDLEITGNGTQDNYFTRAIKDYDAPRGITKTGTSRIQLNGMSTYHGSTIVSGGEVRMVVAGAGLDGTSKVVVGQGAKFTMSNGLINTGQVEVQTGGTFAFTGGKIQTGEIVGSFTNAGGTLAGDATLDTIPVSGNYTQNSGTLLLRIGQSGDATLYDNIAATGTVKLGGTFDLDFADLGSGTFNPNSLGSYALITAGGGITGTFSQVLLPTLANPALQLSIAYEPTSFRLVVGLKAGTFYTPGNGIDRTDLLVIQANYGSFSATAANGDNDLDGDIDGADILLWQQQLNISPNVLADFNQNGVVDAADLAAWKANVGLGTGAVLVQGDADLDGDVDGADVMIWQQRLGGITGFSQPVGTPVPEFSTQDLSLVAMWLAPASGYFRIRGRRSRNLGADDLRTGKAGLRNRFI